MAIKYTNKNEEKKNLPTLEFLEKGTIIEFTNGFKGLVIASFGIDIHYVSFGKSILLFDSLNISSAFIKEAVKGTYKKVLGKISEIIVEE